MFNHSPALFISLFLTQTTWLLSILLYTRFFSEIFQKHQILPNEVTNLLDVCKKTRRGRAALLARFNHLAFPFYSKFPSAVPAVLWHISHAFIQKMVFSWSFWLNLTSWRSSFYLAYCKWAGLSGRHFKRPEKHSHSVKHFPWCYLLVLLAMKPKWLSSFEWPKHNCITKVHLLLLLVS